MRRLLIFIGLLLAMLGSPCALAATPAADIADKDAEWFKSDQGREAMECILSWQSSRGDWPKNKDTTSKRYTGDRSKLDGTFDNGATTGELRALARAYAVTRDARYKTAFLAGFDHILSAQYPSGGWPQFSPPGKKYHRHITFNDGSMIRLMEFLRDVSERADSLLLDQTRSRAAKQSIERGIECIVKCQIVVDGKLTVWCAQHDEQTLAPTKARDYELATLSGSESAGVLKFLMSIEQPSPDVIRAVKAGVAWFDASKIEGYRYRRSKSEPNLVKAPDAGPLWARFYEIESNRPLFSDRDGIAKYRIEEIGAERRSGYSWYGNWGESVAKAFAKWPHR